MQFLGHESSIRKRTISLVGIAFISGCYRLMCAIKHCSLWTMFLIFLWFKISTLCKLLGPILATRGRTPPSSPAPGLVTSNPIQGRECLFFLVPFTGIFVGPCLTPHPITVHFCRSFMKTLRVHGKINYGNKVWKWLLFLRAYQWFLKRKTFLPANYQNWSMVRATENKSGCPNYSSLSLIQQSSTNNKIFLAFHLIEVLAFQLNIFKCIHFGCTSNNSALRYTTAY